jgi:Zn-dependent peptidase ImmA (M78 family)
MLDAIASALDYPRDFFFQSDRLYGPGASEFFHRKRASLGVKDLDRIHAQINIRRIHIDRLTRSADVPVVTVPRFDPDEFHGDVEEIARAVRATWQLPRGPIKNLIETIEDAGGIVIRMRFDTNKVDAVSWWVPGNQPMFFVNETMPADRERMTLAHELGHLVMHAVVRPDMEDEATRFAGAFLMPSADVREDLRSVDLRSLSALKPHWRASMQALLSRASEIGTITPGRAKYLWMQLSRAGYRGHEPPELDFPKEMPSLLQELVELHTGQLGYDLPQLAKMLAWKEHETASNYGLTSDPRSRFRVVK